MKKLSIYIFILSVLILPVLAADANSYKAGDFNKNPEQMAVLEERDKIRINWEDKEHQIHVSKIYLDKKKVDLTAFIEGSEVPYYTTVTPKTSLQLDFDQNGIFDLKISVFNILEEGGKKFAALKLEKLQPDSSKVTTLDILEKKPDNKLYEILIKNKFYFFAGIIFLAILLAFGILKRRTILKSL